MTNAKESNMRWNRIGCRFCNTFAILGEGVVLATYKGKSC